MTEGFYREWRCRVLQEDGKPVLQSLVKNSIWLDGTLTADALPEAGGSLGAAHGIHAARADSRSTSLTSMRVMGTGGFLVVGAVELWGQIAEHEDGIYRAEHARVLALRCVPPAGHCETGCDRYMIIDRVNAPDLGPGPCPPYYVLRKPCRGPICGTVRTRLSGREWIVIAETTAGEIERQLCERYEVPRLAEGIGPWRWPVGARQPEGQG